MSIIKHITLQKNVAHDFRYDPRIILLFGLTSYRWRKVNLSLWLGGGPPISCYSSTSLIQLFACNERANFFFYFDK